jgi:glycerol-3-phosphate dehydrogenase
MNTFSATERADILAKMQATHYDLLVIGGGITGAGIAMDAASRGLKVALVEKKDFAHGTSSRSTKLVHGGLRYLKQFEVGLVREVGSERATVHRNARHLVVPERMLLPIVENGSLGKALSSIGLWVYDWLADVEADERRKMLSKEETADLEPLLRTDILRGGGLYYEYRTDDARLTIENIKTARGYGADCVNYAELTGFQYENNLLCGAQLFDHIDKKTYEIKAKKIVNAAGPWVDLVRGKDAPVSGKKLHLTKGVHLVVQRQRFPLRQSVYFDVPSDGRMIFAIPRGATTYIGTTDTTYSENIEVPYTSVEDVRYLLDAVNFMFPEMDLKENDIVSSWAGLRPLVHEDGKNASEISRKDEIFISDSGLVSIAGGKLTGYRKMAERTVDLVVKQLKKNDKAAQYEHLQKCHTEHIRLSGGDFENDQALAHFIELRAGEAKQAGIDKKQVSDLVYKYGSNTPTIIEKAYELMPLVESPALRLHFAELWYGVTHEMCACLSDYLVRRTGRLYFERPTLSGIYTELAREMAKLLGWDNYRLRNELLAFEHEYKEALHFEGEVFV